MVRPQHLGRKRRAEMTRLERIWEPAPCAITVQEHYKIILRKFEAKYEKHLLELNGLGLKLSSYGLQALRTEAR